MRAESTEQLRQKEQHLTKSLQMLKKELAKVQLQLLHSVAIDKQRKEVCGK